MLPTFMAAQQHGALDLNQPLTVPQMASPLPGMANLRRPTAPSHLLDQLQNRFEVEWGNVDPMHTKGTPTPLVVTDDQGLLLGGLAFTISPKPASAELGVWINGLVVSPAYRRRGIASRLIEAAEFEACRQHIPELYVYTDVPALYSSNGWTELAREGDHLTLTKARPY